METLKDTILQGNIKLLTLFRNKRFDKATASQLLAEISDLNEPILSLDGYSSTYLYEAESYNNVDAVRFLLENGADPNYCNLDLSSWCALDDLHFLWEEMQDEATQRLEIAKLFFEYGGNPNLPVDGETLYDHVLWEVFCHDTPHDQEYLRRFFTLLLAYGGGGGESYAPKPNFTEPIDKSRIDEYAFKIFLCEDGYHLEGHLFNPDGIDIGIV